jgi:hypothetical protein
MPVCDPTAAIPERTCNGYYLVENTEENELYECNNSQLATKCNKLPSSTRGYFKVTDSIEAQKYQYIKCDGTKCVKLQISSMKRTCDTVGELIYNSSYNEAYLCTDSKVYYTFDYDKLNLIYHFDTDETIFTGEKDTDIVISIYYNYMIPLDISELSTNIYLIKNKMYLFINKGKEKYKFERLDTNGVMAFRCFNDQIYEDINGVLLKNEEYLDDIPDVILNSIKIYQCKKGTCNATFGYIRYDIEAGKNFKIALCNYSCYFVNYSNKNCEMPTNNIAYNSSGFKLCTYTYNKTNNKYYYKDVELSNGTSVMYIASLIETSSKYNYILYITDKLRNVVAVNQQSGYYLLEIYGHKELLICESNGCYIGTDYEGYYINTLSEESNSFIYCYNGECDITTKDNGYFTNELNIAWKCVSSECTLLTLQNSCNSNNYGISYYDEITFCIGEQPKYFGSNSRPYYYPISVDAKSSLFPKYANGTDTILIVLDKYSVTQHITNTAGINVSYDNRETVENEVGSTKYVCTSINSGCNVTPNKCNPATSTGGCYGYYLSGTALYYCDYNDEDKISCEAKPSSTRGYFAVVDPFHYKEVPYIKCDGSTCTKMDLPTKTEYDYEENKCNVDNVGKLLYYNKQMEIGICINASILSRINYMSGKEIISLDVSNNIFAKSPSSKYAMIEYSSYSIEYVDTSVVPNNTYLISNKVISVTDGILDFVPMTQIAAFKYDISMAKTCYEDIMKFFRNILVTENEYKIDLTSTLSNISLYDCKNGICIQTTGYIKHNSSNSTDIKVSQCSPYCDYMSISNLSSNTCNSSQVNRAYYNSKEFEFKICIKDYTDYKEVVINNSKENANYIFSYQGKITMTCSEMPTYNLFVSDIGGNIIGLSKTDGNYLLDLYNDGTVGMVKCGSTSTASNVCMKSNGSNGYYLNSGTQDSSQLIYCNDDKCKIMKMSNGYFINSDGEAIKCESSKCTPFEVVSKTCDNHNNELIGSKGYMKYCNKDTEVEFTYEDQFYPLTNVSATESVYPGSISTGEDTILIKIDRFSATQYITNGICVNEVNTRDNTCKFTSPTLYICTNENESCKYGQLTEGNENGGLGVSDFELFTGAPDNSSVISRIHLNIIVFIVKLFIVMLTINLMF